jgi:WD40 repeat protein/serine/threonine protein kinase/tetratricopeptide (TPR) repeat protein
MSDPSLDRDPLEALAEEFVERFRRGERPALSEYTSRFPALAAEIRDLFPALVMLEEVRPEGGRQSELRHHGASAGQKLERLGDYRILREVGRGGMGIVYEAEQESLGRHVALKVLPSHSLLEPRQLERFQREARSAARLHHTNIVPVFGVGDEDGLHYYVMQFIHGQALDQVLAVLQRLRQQPIGGASPDAHPERESADMASVVAAANSLLSGVFAVPGDVSKSELRLDGEQKAAPQPSVSTTPSRPVLPAASGSSSSSEVRLPGQPHATTLSDSGQPYWQSVARIGLQVADALVYAHSQGTLHRDIKPANLLLDTQGTVWITDFGLAKAVGSEDLTHTGDVVGTLRYMAPERFRGKADARGDVYGLGLTLYELLTLQPAFGESERDRLLLQVMHNEPPRPRKLNPAVPRDLETIVLKATARNPGHRYQTAAELAGDLQRFIEDKPIRARPVSETEKLWRWCRRNPTVAVLGAAVLVSLVLGIVGVSWKWLEADRERSKADEAEQQTAFQRDQAIRARNDSQLVLAGALLDRGIALAEQGEVGEGLFSMLDALQAAPKESQELTWAIRTNLASWLERTDRLQQFVSQAVSPRTCTFSPDGRQFWIAGSAGVQVWDSATGQLNTSAFLKDNAGGALTLSPDGKIFVTAPFAPGNKPGVVQRWDAATAQPIGEPLRHPAGVRGAVFTPDGKQFATAGLDGVVRLWDSASGKLAREFQHPLCQAVAIAISPDGTTLAAATVIAGQEHVPTEAHLWDIKTGERLGSPMLHQDDLLCIAFSPDGKMVLTGSHDRTAQLWDAHTGKAIGTTLRHSHAVTAVRFAPDGRRLVTGSADGLVRWWDAATGTPLSGTLAVQQAGVRDLAFSPDGALLLAVSEGPHGRGLIHLFELARALSRPQSWGNDLLAKAAWKPGDGESWLGRYVVCHSPDAQLAICGRGHGRALLYDTASGQPLLRAGGPDGPLWQRWPFVGVNAFSPNGRFIATSSRDATAVGEARLWDVATGRLIGSPLVHYNNVSALEFSPDSRLLASGCYDDTVQLWDTASGQRIGRIWPQPGIVVSLAFSPDGKMLAVGHVVRGSSDSGVVLWDIGARTHRVPPMTALCHLVRFSPDSTRLLASSGPSVQFWDTATGQSLSPRFNETAEINNAVFSGEGDLVLLCTTDGTVRLREVPTGKAVGAPMRNAFRANVAVFSPDGANRLVLTGYDDGSARLWHRATQKPIGPRVMQSSRIITGSFAPAGRWFATSSVNGDTRRWPVPTPVEGDLESLTLRLQVHTGLATGEGQTVVQLDGARWQELRKKLAAADAAREVSFHDAAFHDARVRDAEQEGDGFTARWHLDRLIHILGTTPPGSPSALWMAYARRARTWTRQHNFDRAEADYAAALKHGAPDGLVGWYRHRIGECSAVKDWPCMLWYLNRALAVAPADWHLYADRADVMDRLGKTAERDADRARAVEHGAECHYLMATGDAQARRGEWQTAARTFLRASERGRCDFQTWQQQAVALLKVGDREGYRKLCGRIVAWDGATDHPLVANNAAWVCSLGPDALADLSGPVALAEAVVRGTNQVNARAGALNTLGAILYRAGRYRDAIERLNEGIHLTKGPGAKLDWLFLAMAHHRLGEGDQSHKYLDMVRPGAPNTGFSWDHNEVEVLLLEARELIDGK